MVVLLVVQGGPNTVDMMMASAKEGSPLLVLSDSGGAAQDIYDYCVNGGLNMSIERKYAGGADTASASPSTWAPSRPPSSSAASATDPSPAINA